MAIHCVRFSGRAWPQGLPILHFSPQPEPLLVTETHQLHTVSRKKCSRRAEKWKSLSLCSTLPLVHFSAQPEPFLP
jgi:hypothetical protein